MRFAWYSFTSPHVTGCTRSTPRRAARQNGTACTAARSGDAEPGGASDAGDDREADGLAAVADRLSLAVAAEDYARAAALRDELA